MSIDLKPSHSISFRHSPVIEELEQIIKKDDVLLFDMDGTLVNTDNCNNSAYKLAISNVLGDNAGSLLKVKRIERKVLSQLLSYIPQKKLAQIIALKEQYYTLFINKVEVIPHTLAILNHFAPTNKIILTTNARRRRTMQTLSHLDLERKFDAIITKEDCNCDGKFIAALKQYNLDKSKVWVFENEYAQAQIAIATGIDINHIILM